MSQQSPCVAVLGTGLLGAGFVENFLQRGVAVRVWNRTGEKTVPLVQKGAVAAPDPAAAVRGATHVHLVLAEDDAVDAVTKALEPGLGSGVAVYDHSTNLPARVAARFARLRQAGMRYVPAPVFMSPQNAREASGLLVFSCPANEQAEHEEHLRPRTGKALYVGERPDLAAVYKLAGNSMYFALTAAIRDVFAIGRGAGVEAEVMLKLFDAWKVGGAIPFIGQRLLHAGEGPPSFELAMARKDARLMLETAGAGNTIVLAGVATAMDRAIAAGHGQADFAVFAKQ